MRNEDYQWALRGWSHSPALGPAQLRCRGIRTLEWVVWVFSNPPHAQSNTDRWLARHRQAVSDGESEVVFVLEPARADTSY
jgi:hypothetical protein